ncbi:type III pantothenate kinase [Sulfurimonas aquatica]|uniref:Type III pantothenate kinase n=1 Tax=Sulfurimonas aquatica TaxID=2672570 RepID=A0A975GCT9_9BACT|nr:type III pantothenate kinase [Sulfurimonas aquatica]QSZ42051.1 type III pantothenate kinase [Sulfurimonas aquatica]
MLLCDIGNTSYHFLDDFKSYKESVNSFDPSTVDEKVYYISVNAKVKTILDGLTNWIDLSEFIDMKNYYETMGIDRIFAVEALSDAVIVDAGSAITVDVVKEGVFRGGFIYPGVNAMEKTYANISPALSYSFNFECELDIMPKNSQDAISYGFLKTLYSEVISHDMPIVLTGGDSQELKKIFKDAKIDEELIFRGMKKIMKKANIC